ncbi:hypothetical protein ACFZCY_13410 [Streptomyces sp. NPDC007983]|uniref:hypothetical protein n=1 Tax=Streptomyces sp. NPDC007983 TaxID=3364800 RepID=UPI0036EC4AE6
MPTSRQHAPRSDPPQLELGPTPESEVASARSAVTSVLVVLLVLVLCGVCAVLYLSWSVERDIEAHDGSIDVTGENPERDGILQPYENGVDVTFGTPRRVRPVPGDDYHQPGDLTYTYTLLIVNGSGKVLDLAGSDLYESLYEGQSLPDGSIVYGTWKVDGMKREALPDRLADDERMEATVRVNVPPRTPFLNSDLSIADGYETIYMKLGLDA